MAKKHILMLVGDYVEDYEAMVPFQILTMVGHTVDAVCPGKRVGESVKTAVHDFVGDQTYVEMPGHLFRLTADFERVKPEYLRMNERVLDIARHFDRAGKPIAAICHGLQILSAADTLRGRKCISYPAVKHECVAAGASYGEINETFSNAVTDKNLVTAPAWPAHPAWMKQFLAVLGSRIEP
jgi:protease I